MHIINNDKYDYLFIEAKNTNTTYPNSRVVTGDSFPEQIEELLNTEIILRYRLKNFISSSEDDHEFNRPSDDVNHTTDEHFSPPDDMFYYKHGTFIVLRADAVEPYVMIAKHRDKEFYMINSTKKDTLGNYEFLERVSLYCAQNEKFKDVSVIDIYDGIEHDGEVVRIDDGEEYIIIIKESVGESEYRYVLGSEVISVLHTNEDSNMEE